MFLFIAIYVKAKISPNMTESLCEYITGWHVAFLRFRQNDSKVLGQLLK